MPEFTRIFLKKVLRNTNMSGKALEHVWCSFPSLAAQEEEEKHLRIHRTLVDTESFPGWISYEWGFYE